MVYLYFPHFHLFVAVLYYLILHISLYFLFLFFLFHIYFHLILSLLCLILTSKILFYYCYYNISYRVLTLILNIRFKVEFPYFYHKCSLCGQNEGNTFYGHVVANATEQSFKAGNICTHINFDCIISLYFIFISSYSGNLFSSWDLFYLFFVFLVSPCENSDFVVHFS